MILKMEYRIGKLKAAWGVVFAEEGKGQGLGASKCGCQPTVMWVWWEVHGHYEVHMGVMRFVWVWWITQDWARLVSKCHGGVMGHNRKVARDRSKKFEVAPESMSANTELGRPGILMRTRKETSDWEVRAALIWTKSTWELGAWYTAVEVCWVTMWSRLHTCGDRLCVSFLTQLGAPWLLPQ